MSILRQTVEVRLLRGVDADGEVGSEVMDADTVSPGCRRLDVRPIPRDDVPMGGDLGETRLTIGCRSTQTP